MQKEDLFIAIPRNIVIGIFDTETKTETMKPLNKFELSVFVLLNLRKNYFYNHLSTTLYIDLLLDDMKISKRSENRNKIINAVKDFEARGLITLINRDDKCFTYELEVLKSYKNDDDKGFLKLHVDDAIKIYKFINDGELTAFRLYILLLTLNSFNHFNLKQHYIHYLSAKLALGKRAIQNALKYLKENHYICQLHTGERNESNRVPAHYIAFDTYNPLCYYLEFLKLHNRRIIHKGVNNYTDLEIENDKQIVSLLQKATKQKKKKVGTFALIENGFNTEKDLPF
ncbi:hypothetical protein PX458_000042 [Staphylococcus pseudintermedius]|uniref:Uncharacterized protein n=1 Tax=Staphylococcus pseudintermedius TaxID=283734 RepID=A0A7T7NW50_STAPS|nr:hypothetical protein [Staphylococcus pseudintermedius]EGQ0289776.1 hypothetical protein [Staphylococcus pseudintermedius]EGQ0294044.1 hypothetical protein [Staphylococcus pseudintermedius]EGQ0306760.1 hypothetical protein [Staphylococcus pseudintermedius]EGQ0311196.1 hypothetical protein [Staphylococcus pseudintermedius]EGQ0316143.1 hypothetical protein [Staphylococcus pseudintermedius]